MYRPQSLNRYSYVWNNPVKYTDPTGHYVETGFDLAFIAYDVYEIQQDPTNLWNYAALAADGVGVIVPLGTGFGLGVRVVQHGGDVAKVANRVVDISKKTGGIVPNNTKTYNSFQQLKKDVGPAGPGKHHHHIVEQNKSNVQRHGAQAIHNTVNVKPVPAQVNQALNGFYSSVQKFSAPQTVRQWLDPKTYQEKYEFGLKQLDAFMKNFNNKNAKK